MATASTRPDAEPTNRTSCRGMGDLPLPPSSSSWSSWLSSSGTSAREGMEVEVEGAEGRCHEGAVREACKRLTRVPASLMKGGGGGGTGWGGRWRYIVKREG